MLQRSNAGRALFSPTTRLHMAIAMKVGPALASLVAIDVDSRVGGGMYGESIVGIVRLFLCRALREELRSRRDE